jgi:hypothetical protein
MTDINWEELRKLPIPTTLRLACGADVPHEVGTVVFCHYDMKVVRITRKADHAQPDTSGALPDRAAWWVDTDHGTFDGSRLCSLEFARKRGWLLVEGEM